MAKRLWATVLVASLAGPVWSQIRVGAEFRVNQYTTGTQTQPAVASDPDGNVLVVWSALDQDGSFLGIFGRHYDPSGAPVSGEFRINAYTTNSQVFPAVAADANGNFMVVWQSMNQDGSGYGVFGRRVGGSGPLGSEFSVNTYTSNTQSQAAVASDTDGDFVVVWHSGVIGTGQDGSGYGVFGQRFSATGVRVGQEFQVSTFTTDNQFGPSVSSDTAGNFVVAWTGNAQDGNNQGIFGQRYDFNGVRQGGEFRVNSYTTGVQRRPAVASDVNGNFVVVWEGRGAQDPSFYGVFAQRYDSAGVAQGIEFMVNSFTSGYQVATAVAYAAPGDFVVAWQSFQGDAYEIIGKRFAAGLPTGEFRANTHTTQQQYMSAIDGDAHGGFTVVWTSRGQDGSYQGVFGQRFASPSDLIFADGFE
jgi:hypothetical protein